MRAIGLTHLVRSLHLGGDQGSQAADLMLSGPLSRRTFELSEAYERKVRSRRDLEELGIDSEELRRVLAGLNPSAEHD